MLNFNLLPQLGGSMCVTKIQKLRKNTQKYFFLDLCEDAMRLKTLKPKNADLRPHAKFQPPSLIWKSDTSVTTQKIRKSAPKNTFLVLREGCNKSDKFKPPKHRSEIPTKSTSTSQIPIS